MKLIHKNPEPKSLLQYRLSPNSCYRDMPGTTKKELKESLLEEQNFLCAYCTSKININNMKVEHYKSQKKAKNLALNYNNMLAVCRGGEDNNYGPNCLTCDTSKKSIHLAIIDPLNNVSINSLVVSNEGEIGALETLPITVQKEINNDIANILNLNIELFKENRKKTYKVILSSFPKKDNKTLKKKDINKALSILKNTPFSELAEKKLLKKLKRTC